MSGSRASCRRCWTRGRSTPRRRWRSSRRTSATSFSSPGSKRRSSSPRRPSKELPCSSTILLRARRTTTGSWRGRFWRMARRNKRASMREGPLSDLFRSTSEDAPVDPPEAPRYGRQDPADAKKVQDEADRPAGHVDAGDPPPPARQEEVPPTTPPAGEAPSGDVPLQAEEAPALYDQEVLGSERDIETSGESAPERLKRVFNEEPLPRREEFVPENPRYG